MDKKPNKLDVIAVTIILILTLFIETLLGMCIYYVPQLILQVLITILIFWGLLIFFGGIIWAIDRVCKM